MDFFDEINGLEYLFLVDAKEPEQNRLLITVKAATISEQEEYVRIADKNLGPVKRVSMDGAAQEYQVYFRTYAAYCITDESFTVFQEQDERIGRLFCIYSKSAYLDYIRNNTIVEHVRDGELRHYGIICQNHIIDIASMEEPVITKKMIV